MPAVPRTRSGWAVPLPRDARDRVRALAVAALLLAIASLGIYRSATLDQPSWQGASFGMFATYDNISSRTIAAYAITDAGRQRIGLPGDLHDDATRLTVVPTEHAADALARRLLARAGDGVAAVDVEVRRVVVERDGGLRLDVEPITMGAAAR